MKEEISIRLYESPGQGACCDSQKYYPDETVRGWDFERGEQIGLREQVGGGYLMGRIEQIDPQVRVDETGRFKLAIVWTLD